MDGKTLADYGREMESYRKAGMAGCKFKVGGLRPKRISSASQAARKAAGDDFVIVVDANRGWNVQDAITLRAPDRAARHRAGSKSRATGTTMSR